jgi:hypothetical protein
MQDIRIDTDGNQRCWFCGGKNFTEKRTFGSKAALGVGSLLTHKKLKCQSCGEYNDTGSTKPFVDPKASAPPPMAPVVTGPATGLATAAMAGAATTRTEAERQDKSAEAKAAPIVPGEIATSEPLAPIEAAAILDDAATLASVASAAPMAPTRSLEPSQPLESYNVTYRGGLPDLPKPKVGKIELEICADRFKLKPTSGTKKFWSEMEIPYNTILNLEIVERTLNSFEGIAGRLNSRQLNQRNNIHITYLGPEGDQLLRLEMLSGVTVMGQAKKCNEFQDRLRNLRIREQFVANAPASAPSALVAPTSPLTGVADELVKLAALRDSGVLSAEEFDTQKAKLLGGG